VKSSWVVWVVMVYAAIIHYMIDNPDVWRFKTHRTNNNGLSVIERI